MPCSEKCTILAEILNEAQDHKADSHFYGTGFYQIFNYTFDSLFFQYIYSKSKVVYLSQNSIININLFREVLLYLCTDWPKWLKMVSRRSNHIKYWKLIVWPGECVCFLCEMVITGLGLSVYIGRLISFNQGQIARASIPLYI